MAKIGTILVCLGAMAVLGACSPQTHYFGIDLTQPSDPATVRESDAFDPAVSGMAQAALRKDCGDPERVNTPGCEGLTSVIREEIASPSPLATGDLSRLPLVNVARRAQAGDNHAQLELAMRFEEGRGGVEQDFGNAITLYDRAASHSGGPIPVWIPGSGGEGGMTHWVDSGPLIPGLPEARERRDALRARLQAGDR